LVLCTVVGVAPPESFLPRRVTRKAIPERCYRGGCPNSATGWNNRANRGSVRRIGAPSPASSVSLPCPRS